MPGPTVAVVSDPDGDIDGLPAVRAGVGAADGPADARDPVGVGVEDGTGGRVWGPVGGRMGDPVGGQVGGAEMDADQRPRPRLPGCDPIKRVTSPSQGSEGRVLGSCVAADDKLIAATRVDARNAARYGEQHDRNPTKV